MFARARLCPTRAITGASSQLQHLTEREWVGLVPGHQQGFLSQNACELVHRSDGYKHEMVGTGVRITLATHPGLCAPRVPFWSCSPFACAGPWPPPLRAHASPTAPVPAGDHAVLCKGLLAVKQQEGCRGCRAASGLQPLPDSRGLGVGKLGSKRGCEVAALIRRGEKNPVLWDCWESVGALSKSSNAWQHTHCFILHPFAILGASAGCHLPRAAGCSACPAVAGGGRLLRGEGRQG